jgi:hypothetical protein
MIFACKFSAILLTLGLLVKKSSTKCVFNVTTCEGAVHQEVRSSDYSDFQLLRISKCNILNIDAEGTIVDHTQKLPPNVRSVFHRTYSKQNSLQNKYRVIPYGNNGEIYMIGNGVVQMIPSRYYSVFDLHHNVYSSYARIRLTPSKDCGYSCDGRGLYYHTSDYLMNFLVPWAHAFSHIVATALPLLDFTCSFLEKHPNVDLLMAIQLQYDLMVERCPSLPFRGESSTSKRTVVFLHTLGRKTCVMAKFLLYPFYWNSKGVPAELGMVAPGSLSQQLTNPPVSHNRNTGQSSVTKKTAPREIIYLPRPKGVPRHLMDEKALMTRLCRTISAKSGLKLRVYKLTGNYTFDRHVFENARAVISPHGGGLTNMLFTPPDTIIFEIVHPIEENPFHIGLAHSLSLKHVVIPAINYSHHDQTVPIELSSRKVAVELIRKHISEMRKYRVHMTNKQDAKHVRRCMIMVNNTLA